uniref:Uncharacterized protein n=2 Tax=Picea TaxID=3328 RepID=A0A101M3T6_PICGL|nr:hypothetical protein ABT39_MTgene210 [Picea glauca]QHR90087.1 hypothetical protein Q903MT_gene4110 [Picea sitchensis]
MPKNPLLCSINSWFVIPMVVEKEKDDSVVLAPACRWICVWIPTKSCLFNLPFH